MRDFRCDDREKRAAGCDEEERKLENLDDSVKHFNFGATPNAGVLTTFSDGRRFLLQARNSLCEMRCTRCIAMQNLIFKTRRARAKLTRPRNRVFGGDDKLPSVFYKDAAWRKHVRADGGATSL